MKKDIVTIIIVLLSTGLSLLYLSFLSEDIFQPGVKTLPPTVVENTNTEVNIPIITYHYVEVVTDKRDFIRQSLSILPSTFEGQIRKLRENGYEPVFVKEIPNIVKGTTKPEKKPVALTFDDGYTDFYTDVFPIIKENKVKVTAYIIPNFIGRLNYMTKEQIKEVVASGLVEIGAHTMEHADLPNNLDETAKATINDSKITLESVFYIKVETFSYPYGFYNDKIAQMVRDAGYTAAVSDEPGTAQSSKNMYYLSRIRVGYFDSIF